MCVDVYYPVIKKLRMVRIYLKRYNYLQLKRKSLNNEKIFLQFRALCKVSSVYSTDSTARVSLGGIHRTVI